MPKPVLQAMVLADHVYQDRPTGKFIIAGTFSTIFRGRMERAPAPGEGGESGPGGSPGASPQPPGMHLYKGPLTQAGSPYLYLALVDVHGKVPLSIKLVNLSDAAVLLELQFAVGSHDPVAVAEYVLALPPLPMRQPGAYSLDLVYESEILGSWRLHVRQAPEPPPPDSP